MNRILMRVALIIVAGAILGLAGFTLGRYSVRNQWEQEKRKTQTDIDGMQLELGRLKDSVSKIRHQAAEIRAKADPRATLPRRKGLGTSVTTRQHVPSGAADYSDFPPTPLSQPVAPEAADQ
jgi:hypothetical protein